MLIVSKDRTTIYNFDNTDFIFINGCNEIRINTNCDKNSYLLGTYKTEERAKEILLEIIKLFNMSGNNKFSYFMPED